MLLFFSFFASSEIHYLNLSLGVHHVTYNLNAGDSLCLNVTQFPFYIIFSDFPEGVTYYEYSSRSLERHSNQDIQFNSANYSTYRNFALPYGSITFEANSEVSLTFTYAIVPGYCETGVYINTDTTDKVNLSSQLNDFYELRNYDDKCFFYTATTSALQLTVNQVSTDPYNRIFYYTNYSQIEPYSGNISFVVKGDSSEDEVPFLRVLTSSGKPPSSLEIDMSAIDASPPSDPKTVIHIPRIRNVECEKETKWYSEELVILLAVICGFLAIVLILLIICTIANKKSQ